MKSWVHVPRDYPQPNLKLKLSPSYNLEQARPAFSHQLVYIHRNQIHLV